MVDSRAIAEAKIIDGALVHGSLQWRVVVLPGVDTLRSAAWENLARFVRAGGVLIALGVLPANSEAEFPSARVQALAEEIFGPASNMPVAVANDSGGGGIFLPAGRESLLPIVLKDVIEPDASPIESRSLVRATHRRIDGHEVYFVINDSPKAWSAEVRFAATGQAEEWNPSSGKVVPLTAGGPIPLSLEPYGATFLRFSEPRSPRRHRLTTGALSRLVVRASR
jgi:hypothetical protein